jgi:23S rRNA G2445 N2-methylase RlmL
MGEMASIEISLSGRPLQKRGYREESVPAPIRENLAQALIYFSGWDRRSPLIDPMCGAGTILIEAALIIKNKNWINYDSLKKSYIFEMVFREVKSPHRIADQLLKKKEIPILGYDSDPFALELARKNAEKAGVEDMIQFEAIEIQDFKNIHSYKNGFIITNPPYGERMGEKEEVKELYEKFGKSLKDNFSGFTVAVVSGDTSLLGHLKLKAEDSKRVLIGKLQGKLVKYHIQ